MVGRESGERFRWVREAVGIGQFPCIMRQGREAGDAAWVASADLCLLLGKSLVLGSPSPVTS